MKQETGSVMSLSFVDVLANSFASLLVLFFIMVALRGVLDWSQAKTSYGGLEDGSNEPKSPFLVLVNLESQLPQGVKSKNVYPWTKNDANKTINPWTVKKDDKGVFTWVWSVGIDYAVLYADRPPPADAILGLQLNPRHQAGTIHVYEKGLALEPQKFPADAGWVKITMSSGGKP